MDDIAVVGIGLRFPGRADSAEGLWSVLTNAESQWSEFPMDRLNINGFYHPSRNRQGSIPFKGAHLLQRDVTKFDAPFFSITADEACAVDPQQRLLLEVSYEALENAGLRKEDLEGSSTSVFVGSFVKDYEQVCLRDPDDSPQYAATGNGIALMSNRISYFFNLCGPSETVDTGCSGSLVSIHNAVQSLRSHESSLAIAAGAGLILTPATMMPMTALNFLSPDGKCFTFDARANGYGRGEGIGVVILKCLSDALRDNDTIRAVIRGSSKNQDGRTLGITLPSSQAQSDNIRLAYTKAGLGFEQTGFVECHGTGTQAGDWRELKAISETISQGRSSDHPVVVGSLKPNIGHLEGAAGVAGMIKGILVLEHGKIPPQANYDTPNPDMDLQGWRVKVPTSVLDWPLPGARRVSVNCFGFGGSNVHLIMDDAASYMQSRNINGQHNTQIISTGTSSGGDEPAKTIATPYTYLFSAPDKPALLRVLKAHMEHLEMAIKSGQDDRFLRNYAYTVACRRSQFAWRTHIVCGSRSELVNKIQSLNDSDFSRASKSRSRICFAFGGQGAQWPRMGHDLLVFQTFRESLAAASMYMKEHLHSPFDLLSEVLRERKESIISKPEVSQPATTAIQIALVELLRTVGVEPSHVIGHSSGEIAAAYACGVISRESAWTVAYWRGFYAAAASILTPELPGAMMVVALGPEQVQEYMDGGPGKVQIACINSHTSVTLSGGQSCIETLSVDLTHHGVFNRILPVDVAYHSDFMKLVSNHYEWSLQAIEACQANSQIGMFSTVTGSGISGEDVDGAYWARNMVSQVQYATALEEMMRLPTGERPDIILEVSPRSQLRTPTIETMEAMRVLSAAQYFSVAGARLLDLQSLHSALGSLWEQGAPVDMLSMLQRSSDEAMPKCLVDLPTYPWNHSKSYWHESHLSSSIRFRPHGREDLIGVLTPDSTPFEPKWRGFLRVSENPWLQDHKIQKTIVYPAAGMICMALEAAKQISEGDSRVVGFEISDFKIEKAIIVPESKHGVEVSLNVRRTKLELSPSGDLKDQFVIYTKQLDSPWKRHATGYLHICLHRPDFERSFRRYEKRYTLAKTTCTNPIVPRQLYEVLDNVGMNYGATFRNIKELTKGDTSCVSRIKVPDTRSKMPEKFEYPHILHPATLDAMFHTLFAVDNTPMVPVSLRRIFVSSDVPEIKEDFMGASSATRHGLLGASADIAMFRGESQRAQVIIDGLELTRITNGGSESTGFVSNNSHLATEIVWKEDIAFASPGSLAEMLDLLSHKIPGLSILQFGTDEDLMKAVLDAVAPSRKVTPRLSRYTLVRTDKYGEAATVPNLFMDRELEAFAEAIDVSTIKPNGSFDLVLATGSEPVSVDQLQGYLSGQGLLIHGRSPAEFRSLSRPLSAMTLNIHRPLNTLEAEEKLHISVVYAHRMTPESLPLLDNLQSQVQQSIPEASMTVTNLDALVERGQWNTPRVVVSLLDVDGEEDSSVFNWNQQSFNLFHQLQAGTKRMLWVTRGSHMKPTNPRGSPIMGLLRTLISEDPLKRYVTLDLGSTTMLGDERTAATIASVLKAVLLSHNSTGNLDAEYAEEDGRIYIPRLAPLHSLNGLIEGSASTTEYEEVPFACFGEEMTVNQGIEHVPATPGLSLQGSHYTKFRVPELGHLGIEIDFMSALLTTQDLDTTRGRSNRQAVGIDVRGRVRRVGSKLSTNVKVGDEVAGLAFGGALKSILQLDGHLTAIAPEGFVPSLYIAAYFALVHISRARKGKTVLIRGAASSHGIAAVILAQQLKLKIFGTVMEDRSEEQRRILEGLGLSTERVWVEGSPVFHDELRVSCGGDGVDIVYNTIGEAYARSESHVQLYGCVVELCHASGQDRAVVQPLGLTYTRFDTYSLLLNNADLASEMFARTLHLLEGCGRLPRIHATSWQVGDVDKALHAVAEMPCYGSALVQCNSSNHQLVKVVKEKQVKSLRSIIHNEGTYLIVGGFLGLGRSIAELLIDHGARDFAFISRSGATTKASKAAMSNLQSKGANISALTVDILNETALNTAITHVQQSMPTIRGVFQCAAVIQDAIFDNMTFAEWNAAVLPKTIGSWNLVESISAAGMNPFYVFLASSAGVIGNRGQANYAAGNSFEDAMAHSLRLQGKHAVSIDLGPVLGAGMLAEDEETLDMLRASGFHSISHEDFLRVISHAITGEILEGQPMPPQVVLGVGTGAIIRQNQPADPYWTRTALYSYLDLIDMPPPDLSAATSIASMGIRAALARAPSTTAAGKIVAVGIREMLAKAMTMLPEEIDMDKPPNAYGVDSLVAIGLRNWVQGSCGVEISLFEVLSDQSVGDMGTMIAKRGGYGGGGDD